jgi:alpha-tubulin suppressor-like RCC1 family protein
MHKPYAFCWLLSLVAACSPPVTNTPDASIEDSSTPADTITPPADAPSGDAAVDVPAVDGAVDPCAGGACPAVTQLSLGQDHSCAVLMGGAARCWGRNLGGQLGDGTTMDRTRPVPIVLANIAHMAAGYEHTCAARMDGTVHCWGAGSNGQLGNGAMNNSPSPVAVMGITNASKVVAGAYASCALLRDRTVRYWGRGTDLGTGSLANSAVPVTPMGLSDVIDLAMGHTNTRSGNSQTTCALLSTGRIKCWGYGNEGQIGDGTRNSARMPTDVMGITTARAVFAGGNHLCALLMDNTARCWGNGSSGELGDGASELRTTPVAVAGLNTIRTMALGDWFSCAVLMDGSAQCWGDGGRAQLGRGVIPGVGMSRFPVPAPVVGLRNIVAMGAGEQHACAFTMDGVTRCWGDNTFGQLGTGSATSLERFPTPLPVQW